MILMYNLTSMWNIGLQKDSVIKSNHWGQELTIKMLKQLFEIQHTTQLFSKEFFLELTVFNKIPYTEYQWDNVYINKLQSQPAT